MGEFRFFYRKKIKIYMSYFCHGTPPPTPPSLVFKANPSSPPPLTVRYAISNRKHLHIICISNRSWVMIQKKPLGIPSRDMPRGEGDMSIMQRHMARP